MATQQQRRERATRALLDACADLLAAGSLANISVQEIGHVAGLSRGAVNFYYGSKQNLVLAVANDLVARWSHLQAPGQRTQNALTATINRFFSDRRNPHMAASLLYEALGPSPQIRTTIQTAIIDFERYVASCIPHSTPSSATVTTGALIGLATHSQLMTTTQVQATLQAILAT